MSPAMTFSGLWQLTSCNVIGALIIECPIILFDKIMLFFYLTSGNYNCIMIFFKIFKNINQVNFF